MGLTSLLSVAPPFSCYGLPAARRSKTSGVGQPWAARRKHLIQIAWSLQEEDVLKATSRKRLVSPRTRPAPQELLNSI
jgi:hypothetical protein